MWLHLRVRLKATEPIMAKSSRVFLLEECESTSAQRDAFRLVGRIGMSMPIDSRSTHNLPESRSKGPKL